MSMNYYFDISTDNTTWLTLPAPSSLTDEGEDLDDDSFRSVANGNIVRHIVSYKWHKLSFAWNWLSDDEAIPLIKAIKSANNVYLHTKSQMFTNSEVTFKGYISKYSAQLQRTSQGIGWLISFNFIEGTR